MSNYAKTHGWGLSVAVRDVVQSQKELQALGSLKPRGKRVATGRQNADLMPSLVRKQ
jgi:hypothetical protein